MLLKNVMMIDIRRLKTNDENFQSQLEDLLAWEITSDNIITNKVRDILTQVKRKGDEAVLNFSRCFDRVNSSSLIDLEISLKQANKSLNSIPTEQRNALEFAADRIYRYHEHQKQNNWSYTENDGTVLGQQVTPLDSVGLYVPGGKAAYPSSVLMNAMPAKVAGVSNLIMVVPTPDGVANDLVLAAAAIAKVDRIFAIGGAQAIAALAYGTETIPQVDKIVGPGNIYVTTAKNMVFGSVGIDIIAGPSEILVICDGNINPDWVAMDLFSQAEHDEKAQSILITPDSNFLQLVEVSMQHLLPTMERKKIITRSLADRGALIQVEDLDEAVEIANIVAPEHLELLVEDPIAIASKIRHAGAIFMGHYSSEALGDFCAGPNHILPTSRTARFSSPLGVHDFQKRSNLINISKQGAKSLGQITSILARGEGLTAHARSVEYRFKD